MFMKHPEVLKNDAKGYTNLEEAGRVA